MRIDGGGCGSTRINGANGRLPRVIRTKWAVPTQVMSRRTLSNHSFETRQNLAFFDAAREPLERPSRAY